MTDATDNRVAIYVDAAIRRYESNLRLSRDAKRRVKGICVDCGTETGYNGHGKRVSDRCQTCASRASRYLVRVTSAAALEALRSYHAETGREPRLHVWIAEKRRPSVGTMYRVFGSWKSAVRAAGFEPGKAGRKRKAAA